MARMAIAALCTSTFPRFWVVKNTGDSPDMIRIRMTRMSSGPRRSRASRAPTSRSFVTLTASSRRASACVVPGSGATASGVDSPTLCSFVGASGTDQPPC